MQLASLGRRLERRMRRTIFSAPAKHLRQLQRPSTGSLARYGTTHAGWWIDRDLAARTIASGSLVLSAGAGEDISFDLEIQRSFQCHVLIVDPTPRAIGHFDSLVAQHKRNAPFPINNSPSLMYDIKGVDFGKLHFVPTALWNKPGMLTLWAPHDPAHVSHSVTNLQRTNRSIEVEAKTASQVLAEHGAAETPLVKLNIEGAELAVLERLFDDDIFPAQIAVALDAISVPGPDTLEELRRVTDRLQSSGYSLVYFNGSTNCLFVRTR